MFDFLIGSPEATAFFLTTFAGIVTAVVSWVAVTYRREILARIPAKELETLGSIAALVVQNIEQRYEDADGPAKLADAMGLADDFLAKYGIKVTAEQLRAAIEAAVFTETDPGTDVPLPDQEPGA